MDYNEFKKRDLDLQKKIADYSMDSQDKEAQIAVNNREIIRLNWERTQLRALHNCCQETAPQRGLDGKVINKK